MANVAFDTENATITKDTVTKYAELIIRCIFRRGDKVNINNLLQYFTSDDSDKGTLIYKIVEILEDAKMISVDRSNPANKTVNLSFDTLIDCIRNKYKYLYDNLCDNALKLNYSTHIVDVYLCEGFSKRFELLRRVNPNMPIDDMMLNSAVYDLFSEEKFYNNANLVNSRDDKSIRHI